jgi:hypothetical protein
MHERNTARFVSSCSTARHFGNHLVLLPFIHSFLLPLIRVVDEDIDCEGSGVRPPSCIWEQQPSSNRVNLVELPNGGSQNAQQGENVHGGRFQVVFHEEQRAPGEIQGQLHRCRIVQVRVDVSCVSRWKHTYKDHELTHSPPTCAPYSPMARGGAPACTTRWKAYPMHVYSTVHIGPNAAGGAVQEGFFMVGYHTLTSSLKPSPMATPTPKGTAMEAICGWGGCGSKGSFLYFGMNTVERLAADHHCGGYKRCSASVGDHNDPAPKLTRDRALPILFRRINPWRIDSSTLSRQRALRPWTQSLSVSLSADSPRELARPRFAVLARLAELFWGAVVCRELLP